MRNLIVENKFAKIEFLDDIKLGCKNEGHRDWTSKLKLEKNRVWIGHELLRVMSMVTFFDPTDRNMLVEGNAPDEESSA